MTSTEPLTPSSQRRRRLPATARRAQFLDTAAQMVAEGGTDAITMEGVAARAGVSKALGYRYFDNADELLLALHEREMTEVGVRVAAALDHAVTFEDAVRLSLTAWLDILAERGSVITDLMQARRGSGPVERQSREIHASVSEFFGTRGAEAFGLTPRTATAAASILISGLNGLIDCWVNREMPRRELIDIYTTMCIGAMEALAERPPLIGGPSTVHH
jgi:AcrR family transcriptional regulator